MDRSQPSVATMFRRALTLRCPQCGSRKTFIKHWMGRYPRCRTCGIRWHRETGFELGPMSLNVSLTFGWLGIGMIAAFVATSPNFPMAAILIGVVSGAILVPVLLYPFTYTCWLAFDLATHRPTEAELAAAAEAVAG